jgi:all-trans-retinol dehydrogenase (NAD+)
MEQTKQAARKHAPDLRVSCYVVDLSDRQAVYATAARVQSDLQQAKSEMASYVSVLVNNAGLASGGQSLLNTDDSRITKLFEVNTMALFWTVKAFLPEMQARGAGHIVTVASMQGHIGLPRMVDYSASKHAAVGFAESLRRELWQDGYAGIGSTCVCPCHVDTEMFKGFRQPLIPSLTPQTVARATVDAVRCGREVVILPYVSSLFAVLNKCLPASIMDQAGHILGVGTAFEGFANAKAQEAARLLEEREPAAEHFAFIERTDASYSQPPRSRL